MQRLASILIRHRAATGVALGLACGVAAWGASRVRLEDVPRKFLSADTQEWRDLEQIFAQFGSDDRDCLVLLETTDPAGWMSPTGATVLRRVREAVRAVEGVAGVATLADVPVWRGGRLQPMLPGAEADASAFAVAAQAAAAHPLAAGRLISADGRATLVAITIAPDRAAIDALTPVVEGIRTAVREVAGATPVSVHVTGVPALRADIFNALHQEQGFFALAGAAVGFLVALVLFRRPWPVIVTAGSAGVASLWAVGVVGLVGVPLDLLSVQLPTLVLVIAFTDAVHLMVDMRSARAAGEAPGPAASDAVRRLGWACALTSLTTAVGFGSLATSGMPVLERYGLLCAMGVGLGFGAVLTVLPWASSFLPIGSEPAGAGGRPRLAARVAEAVGSFAVRRRLAVIVAGGVLVLAFAVPTLWLEPDNSITESLPAGAPSVVALHEVERAFGGALPAFAVVEWDGELAARWPDIAAALSGAADAVRAAGIPGPPLSVLDLLAVAPHAGGGPAPPLPLLGLLPAAARDRLIQPAARRALVAFQLPDQPSAVQGPVLAALDRALQAVALRVAGMRLWLTGTSVVARRNVNGMIVALAAGLGVAALVIFAVIAVAFRSWWFGLVSLPVNALPLLAVGALQWARGEPLQLTAAVAFTVCLGIAVDDTIHLLTRYRLERSIDGDRDAAVRRAVRAVGGACTITTVVITAGFGILATSALPVIRTFALLVCTGFVVALLCDLLLLPALLASLPGRRAPDAPGA